MARARGHRGGTELRQELIELEAQMLKYARTMGDEPRAARHAERLRALEAGEAVEVAAHEIHPKQPHGMRLGADDRLAGLEP